LGVSICGREKHVGDMGWGGETPRKKRSLGGGGKKGAIVKEPKLESRGNPSLSMGTHKNKDNPSQTKKRKRGQPILRLSKGIITKKNSNTTKKREVVGKVASKLFLPREVRKKRKGGFSSMF